MTTFIILHGSSAVGKTYLMSKIVEENADFLGLEMDDCKYWNDYEPTFDQTNLKHLLPNIRANESREFLELFNQSSKSGKRSIEYFVSQLQKLGTKTAISDQQSEIVVATCGTLPAPKPTGAPSIYSWLSEKLSISFYHVLIEIPQEVHISRMEKRRRLHLKQEILENNRKRMIKRSLHDAVISDYDEFALFIKNKTGVGSKPNSNHTDQAQRSLIRIHKNTQQKLKYIQIFGERNSGTNFLKRLVSENMHDPENFLGSWASKKNPINGAKLIGYKHYYTNQQKIAKHQGETLFLVIYKNPYTWIRSTLIKPYHFKACLDQKSISDLPTTRLAGVNVRGDPIPDVHPDTGEHLTIFELREHKIRNWENLVHQVDNVVYINYENLLLHPTMIVQSIVDAFDSLFSHTQVPEHKSDTKYLKKYTTPTPFSKFDVEIINSNMDWSAEARVGYEMNNFFIPSIKIDQ